MTAPTRLIGSTDIYQYGTIVADVYETIPELWYPHSVPVYAQMRRDARLTAILDGYGLQLRRAQWQIDGTGCRPEATRLVADCLGLNVVGEDTDRAGGLRRRGVSWSDHLRSALLTHVFGHYFFEMEAELVGRVARLTTLAERIPATIATIHADPKTGALLGVDQHITGRRGTTTPEIPADRLVAYCRDREGAGWHGESLIRPAYGPWLIKREMMRVAAISNRRWGAGVPVAEALPGTNPSPAQMEDAQRMVSDARAGDQAGAAVPPGFTMKIVGLSGSVPDTVAFIRFLNQEMSSAVLMPHLELGTSESGSRALGESFIDSWTLALESEAEAIADTATRQICARIIDWNWGEEEPVPRVVVSGIGSRREVTAASLHQLLTSGALSADPALEAWVRREYRLPERDPDAPVTTATKPAKPAPDNDEQDDVAASIDGGQVEAHRPGLHDQKRHGRRGGKHVGKPNTRHANTVRGVDQTSWAAARTRDTNDETNPLFPGDDLSDPRDLTLAAIAARQGFDGPPALGNVDATVAAGGVEIHRGVTPFKGKGQHASVSAAEIAGRMTGGPYEPGTGVYGNGYYFTVSARVADHFAKGGGVTTRAALKPDARVIDYDDLRGQMKKWRADITPDIHWEMRKTGYIAPEGKVSPTFADYVMGDPGRWAAMKGYDAIRVTGHQDGAPVVKGEPTARHPETGKRFSAHAQYVVLNRTALVVDAP